VGSLADKAKDSKTDRARAETKSAGEPSQKALAVPPRSVAAGSVNGAEARALRPDQVIPMDDEPDTFQDF